MGITQEEYKLLLSRIESNKAQERDCVQNKAQKPRRKQRGKELEARIEKVFDTLNAMPGILAIRLEVRQARKGESFIYCKKQPFDYCVIAHERRFYAFDAKECETDVWYPSKAPDHQREALEKVRAIGFQSAFVVWFKNYARVCWVDDFSRPARPLECRIFDWNMFM